MLKHFNVFGLNDSGMIPGFLHGNLNSNSNDHAPTCSGFLAAHTHIGNNTPPHSNATFQNLNNTPQIKKGE